MPAAHRPEIASLTGLRAVAALWVVLFHYHGPLLQLFPALQPLSGLLSHGYLGVEIFFVLSGFILSYCYAEEFESRGRRAYGAFLWKRLARIYPVHLFTVGIVAALMLIPPALGHRSVYPTEYSHQSLVWNLLLIQAWGMAEALSFNLPAWSVSCEWFAYLLFPAFAWIAARPRHPTALVAAIAASLAATVLALYQLEGSLNAAVRFPLIRIAGEFLAGCLLYRLWQHARSWRTPGGVGPAAAGLAIGGALLLWRPDPLVAPLACVLVFWLARSADPLARSLGSRPLVVLGELSYSLYMVHAIVRLSLDRVIPFASLIGAPVWQQTGLLMLHGLVIALLTAASYYAVEAPARRRLRRLRA